ncbi:MAG: HAD-IB family phosphatase [Patescibacteria group bacterium]
MTQKNIKTIIFDIDGTITDDVSWLKLTDSLGGSRSYFSQIFAQFRNGEIDYQTCKEKLIDIWLKTGKANKQEFEKIFRSMDLRNGAVEVINYLKIKYKICLITGSMDFFVKFLADKLGVRDFFANTSLYWDELGNLEDLDYYPRQAEKKLEQFNHFIKENNLAKENCVAVGDSENDILLFQEIGRGIVIGSSCPELERFSSAKIGDIGELRNIL